MKRFAAAAFAACLFAVSVFAQGSNIVKTDLSQAEINNIVKKFTRNEALFREALNVYAFNRNAVISTIGMGGQITGTYRRDSFLTFTSDGNRIERIEFAPVSTLTEISVTQADIENLGGLDPFAIEPRNVDKYNFTYVGKEKIDELDLYVFDVAPKVMPESKKDAPRFFMGRIWVDDPGEIFKLSPRQDRRQDHCRRGRDRRKRKTGTQEAVAFSHRRSRYCPRIIRISANEKAFFFHSRLLALFAGKLFAVRRRVLRILKKIGA